MDLGSALVGLLIAMVIKIIVISNRCYKVNSYTNNCSCDSFNYLFNPCWNFSKGLERITS